MPDKCRESKKGLALQGRQAGKAGVGDTLLLDKDMEAFAHAFGEDQGFELEAGADTFGLVHAIVVEIGEIVSIAESEKEMRFA